MKLPNGTGSVHKLSGNRRNPWRAVRTKGWTVDVTTGCAKQIRETIGYFHTRKEAIEALANFNQEPYDLSANKLTFSDVYEQWSAYHFEQIVPSAQRAWISAYKHSAPLHNMRMRDIRVAHLEQCINNADTGQSTKQRMKSLYNLMYRFALKHEYVDKNYAELCDSVKPGPSVIVRTPFTSGEIVELANHSTVPFVDMVLISIYTGWRPQELALLQVENVDLEQHIIFGGMKTEAGRDRAVPIHSSIYPLIENRIAQAKELGSSHLFNDENGQRGTYMTYDKYRHRFKKVMARFSLEHRPHDTRHTFVTLAKKYQVDEYLLKMIVGHSIEDVTEKVYTHRTYAQLSAEIEKIPDFYNLSE